jgi:hypothetical protein
MPDNKNQLVIGFLLLGLVLVGLSTYFSYFAPKEQPTEIRLARVERESGRASVYRSGYTQREPVDRKIDLYNLDSVETQETGEAILAFESSHKIRLSPNTLVTIEKSDDTQNPHVNLLVIRGEVTIEAQGREGELFIGKNGQRIAAAEYNNSQLSQAPVQPPAPNENFPNPGGPEEKLGISDDEINTVMNNNRSQFFKCYTQLLQTAPTAKGNVSLSFTIENNGKLSVAEVTASELPDEHFKKCLLEVLRRIEFRSFQGPQISTLFPLKFE